MNISKRLAEISAREPLHYCVTARNVTSTSVVFISEGSTSFYYTSRVKYGLNIRGTFKRVGERMFDTFKSADLVKITADDFRPYVANEHPLGTSLLVISDSALAAGDFTKVARTTVVEHVSVPYTKLLTKWKFKPEDELYVIDINYDASQKYTILSAEDMDSFILVEFPNVRDYDKIAAAYHDQGFDGVEELMVEESITSLREFSIGDFTEYRDTDFNNGCMLLAITKENLLRQYFENAALLTHRVSTPKPSVTGSYDFNPYAVDKIMRWLPQDFGHHINSEGKRVDTINISRGDVTTEVTLPENVTPEQVMKNLEEPSVYDSMLSLVHKAFTGNELTTMRRTEPTQPLEVDVDLASLSDFDFFTKLFEDAPKQVSATRLHDCLELLVDEDYQSPRCFTIRTLTQVEWEFYNSMIRFVDGREMRKMKVKDKWFNSLTPYEQVSYKLCMLGHRAHTYRAIDVEPYECWSQLPFSTTVNVVPRYTGGDYQPCNLFFKDGEGNVQFFSVLSKDDTTVCIRDWSERANVLYLYDGEYARVDMDNRTIEYVEENTPDWLLVESRFRLYGNIFNYRLMQYERAVKERVVIDVEPGEIKKEAVIWYLDEINIPKERATEDEWVVSVSEALPRLRVYRGQLSKPTGRTMTPHDRTSHYNYRYNADGTVAKKWKVPTTKINGGAEARHGIQITNIINATK